jgi:hypothetical protein
MIVVEKKVGNPERLGISSSTMPARNPADS